MNPKTFKQIASWGKPVGIIMMIGGILNALVGAVAGVLIGGIPGAITVWLGYLLYKTGVEASEFLKDEKEGRVEEILELYGKFLKIQGILLIVTLVILVPLFVILSIVGIASF